jgi:hypothetical protein
MSLTSKEMILNIRTRTYVRGIFLLPLRAQSPFITSRFHTECGVVFTFLSRPVTVSSSRIAVSAQVTPAVTKFLVHTSYVTTVHCATQSLNYLHWRLVLSFHSLTTPYTSPTRKNINPLGSTHCITVLQGLGPTTRDKEFDKTKNEKC